MRLVAGDFVPASAVAEFCERIGASDKTPKKLARGVSGVQVETLSMALLALEMREKLRELGDVTTHGAWLGLARQ